MKRRNALGLHVIGEGVGECLILELPNAAPAIIDCGNVEVADYAVRFVQEDLGWNYLSFVAVTHPHRDHFEGLAMILNAFSKKCEALWVFPGFFQGDALNRYLRWLALTNPTVNYDSTFFSNAVREEWTQFASFAIRNKLNPRVMRTGESIMLGNVSIRCILPSGEIADRFERDMSLCAPSTEWLNKYPNAEPMELPDPPRANLASSVISVEWEKTRLILCGDCEMHSWLAGEKVGAQLSGEIHGLKIGHHGSKNGAYPILMDCLNKSTHAVVTPFRRGRYPLPEAKVIETYKSKCGFFRMTAPVIRTEPAVWDEDTCVPLTILKAAIAEPAGVASRLLMLQPTNQQHENAVGVLFDNEGNAIDQYWGSGTQA